MITEVIRATVYMEDGSDIDHLNFVDEFIEWVESKGMLCVGSFAQGEDDDYDGVSE